jgi:transcriptional antiterminator
MEEELYTLQDLSNVLRIGPRAVAYRMKALGLDKDGKKGKIVYLDREEYDAVVGFSKKEGLKNYNSAFYSRKKIYIIEYFLSNKKNSAINIANQFDLTEHFVNRVLNEYFENNCEILVRSKEI